MDRRLGLSSVAIEAAVALFVVLLAIVVAGVLVDDRIRLLGGFVVGLRLGWLRTSGLSSLLSLLVAVIATWVLVLPDFVPITPFGVTVGTALVIALATIGLAVGFGGKALIRTIRSRDAAAPEAG